MDVTPDVVLAYRLAAHRLTVPLPIGQAVQAAAVTPASDYPPGSASLALAARIDGLDAAALARLLTERQLVTTWAISLAAHVMAAGELTTFTVGTMPQDEDSLRRLLGGLGTQLDAIGMTAFDAVREVVEAAPAVLDRRVVTKAGLSQGVTERVPAPLSPYCPGCDVDHVDDALLRVAFRTGRFCLQAGTTDGVRSHAPTNTGPRRRTWTTPGRTTGSCAPSCTSTVPRAPVSSRPGSESRPPRPAAGGLARVCQRFGSAGRGAGSPLRTSPPCAHRHRRPSSCCWRRAIRSWRPRTVRCSHQTPPCTGDCGALSARPAWSCGAGGRSPRGVSVCAVRTSSCRSSRCSGSTRSSAG